MNAHTRFLNVAVVAAFLLSASGCVCVVGPSRGDLTFLWSFEGQSCGSLQEITEVTIQINGQTLQNNGHYPCLTEGTAGITLLDFRNNTYTYAIQARNASGAVLYEATGSVKVSGDTTVSVNLARAALAPSQASVTWTFPPNGASNNPTCAQAGVVSVDISVDDTTPTRVDCTAGQSTGVLVQNLVAGTHTIDLTAIDSNNFAYYHKRSSLQIVAGTTASAAYAFEWAVGSLPLKWSLNDGSFDLTCGQAGVTTVNIDLMDQNNQYVYGGNGVDVDCTFGGVQGTLFQYLTAGTYRVYLQANAPGSVVYQSNYATPPALTVVAGSFPVVDSGTPIITMVRQ